VLSCGVVCVILRLAIFVELRLVTDRRTDGHRAMASTIAPSRGKNDALGLLHYALLTLLSNGANDHRRVHDEMERMMTVWLCFFSDIIDIFSCRPIAILINDSCY